MSSDNRRDPHSGPVGESAWAADAEARARGRVAMFNATRPGGLDGWTMDLGQYQLMREHILDLVSAAHPDPVTLREVVSAAIDRYATHELFPTGRVRNYFVYTKVDLEARNEIERVPGSGPQRLRLPTPR